MATTESDSRPTSRPNPGVSSVGIGEITWPVVVSTDPVIEGCGVQWYGKVSSVSKV
jgi:hypothetical protein